MLPHMQTIVLETEFEHSDIQYFGNIRLCLPCMKMSTFISTEVKCLL